MLWRQVSTANIQTHNSALLNAGLGRGHRPGPVARLGVEGQRRRPPRPGREQHARGTHGLSQGADASLGQFVDLKPNVRSAAFDLSVLASSPGDTLQVDFNNTVIGRSNLSQLGSGGHYTVSLAGLGSQGGRSHSISSVRRVIPKSGPIIWSSPINRCAVTSMATARPISPS